MDTIKLVGHSCPHDGTWLNFFKVTEWWLQRDATLTPDMVGKKLIFCGAQPQHQWLGEDTDK